jgi:hypothetical protein
MCISVQQTSSRLSYKLPSQWLSSRSKNPTTNSRSCQRESCHKTFSFHFCFAGICFVKTQKLMFISSEHVTSSNGSKMLFQHFSTIFSDSNRTTTTTTKMISILMFLCCTYLLDFENFLLTMVCLLQARTDQNAPITKEARDRGEVTIEKSRLW